jgi:hypothetical protein
VAKGSDVVGLRLRRYLMVGIQQFISQSIKNKHEGGT